MNSNIAGEADVSKIISGTALDKARKSAPVAVLKCCYFQPVCFGVDHRLTRDYFVSINFPVLPSNRKESVAILLEGAPLFLAS